MRAAVFHGPSDIRVESVPDPVIEDRADAVVRITHAAVCGRDLSAYRGQGDQTPGRRCGHEWTGVVLETGSDVHALRPGDHVVAPSRFADGTCDHCLRGLPTSCERGGGWGAPSPGGGQAEAIRAPFADATLVRLPPEWIGGDGSHRRVLPLTEVMAAGHHAALCAGVTPGSTVAVVGDGAVGLCAILAARRLGAERTILLGHHPQRFPLAIRLGATDTLDSSGSTVAAEVVELTSGGPALALECAGTERAMRLACTIVRPGGAIGHVGPPHASSWGIDLNRIFADNIALRGGVAPVRTYLDDLLEDVLAGRLDPSPVLDLEVPLERIGDAYAAMDARRSVKPVVSPGGR